MAKYGAQETNPIAKGYHDTEREISVGWEDKRLRAVTRLRLLSGPGFPLWDVSYCHGELKDGTPVHVRLPFSQLPKRGFKREIIEWAKREGVYAKGLGVLDNISTLQ